MPRSARLKPRALAFAGRLRWPASPGAGVAVPLGGLDRGAQVGQGPGLQRRPVRDGEWQLRPDDPAARACALHGAGTAVRVPGEERSGTDGPHYCRTRAQVICGLRRKRQAGQRLLACTSHGSRHELDSGDLNESLCGLLGREVSAKDFRTWHATVLVVGEAAPFLMQQLGTGVEPGWPPIHGGFEAAVLRLLRE
ncbi:MAG: hypothetical protein ABJB47_15060 [Actinomycetota bacterium]